MSAPGLDRRHVLSAGAALALILAAIVPVVAQVVPGLPPTGGLHVFAQSWDIDEGDRTTKIQQLVTPIGVLIPVLEGAQVKLGSSLVVLSRDEDGETESVSGLSDVKVEGNVGLLDRRIQLSLAVNIPTGGGKLTGQEQDVVFAFVSPDLSVRANRLGEGLNVGGSVAYAHPINPNATAGLSLAFVHKGAYDTSTPSSQTEFRLEPGYEARAAVGVDIAANVYQVRAGATLSLFGKEKTDGSEVYQIGPQLALDLSASRPFSLGRGRVHAGVTAIGRGSNSIVSNGDLVAEEIGMSNDQLLVEVGSSYVITPPVSVAARLLGRYVASNENDAGDARVLEAGVSGSVAVNDRLALSAGGRVIVGEGTGFTGLERSIFGIEAIVRASVRF